MIKQVSFSRLEVFEQCKYRAKLQFVDRIPEPEPSLQETPLKRGIRVHDTAERFIRGISTIQPELEKFKEEFIAAYDKYHHRSKDFELEQMWAFDKDWNYLHNQWDNNLWLRVRLMLSRL
jgi:hypothetical protein